MDSPVISLRSVVALVDRYPVLAGVDFTVSRGEIVGLTGPNGAGKTSLLRLIAGLLVAHEGEAEVFGFDLRRDRRSVRSGIGFVGHEPFLYDDLTVRENAEFFAQTKDVGDSLERVGLDTRADVVAARLSSGQRRRLGLAVLIARAPTLWLLDEPHSGLDAPARQVLADVVREAAANGTTVLFTAHDREAMTKLADRSFVVDGGVVTPFVALTDAPQESRINVG